MLKSKALKLSAIVIGGCIFGLAAPAQAENAPTPATAVTVQTIPTTASATTATPIPDQLVAQKVAPQPAKAKPKFQRETLNSRIFAAATMQQ
jgi:4'-phosphopantetheinyl transferase EntD